MKTVVLLVFWNGACANVIDSLIIHLICTVLFLPKFIRSRYCLAFSGKITRQSAHTHIQVSRFAWKFYRFLLFYAAQWPPIGNSKYRLLEQKWANLKFSKIIMYHVRRDIFQGFDMIWRETWISLQRLPMLPFLLIIG